MTDATRTFGSTGGPPPAGGGAVPRLEPGTRLGTRYAIEAVLGEGGMGTVYRARDLELGRTVALKVIRPDMAARPEILERFKREILLASQVTHRHVLRIHDLGEAGEVRFISMQFVEGADLKALLRAEGPLPVERALALARPLAEALQAAHDAGVVHRDLKPQNVLIDRDGQPYIADFGISRSLDSGSTMTETGAIIGTVDYMAPEQAKGETPDHRGDIYAFGVMLYEMLAGEPPFRAPSALSIMMKRVHETAPGVRRARPEVPAWLSAVVARALERDPAARYQSARDLLRDLDRRRAGVAWRRLLRPRVLAPAGVIVLVAAAAVAGGRFLRPAAPGVSALPAAAAPPRASLAVLPFRNDTGDPRFDWARTALPGLLRSDLTQSRRLRLAGEDRVAEALRGLGVADGEPPGGTALPRLAGYLGVEATVTGRLLRVGERFRIDAVLTRADGGTAPAIQAEGRSEDALFGMIDEVAGRVRAALGVGTGLFETDRGARDLATTSLAALKEYDAGTRLARAGDLPGAARLLEAALAADEGFAAARAALAGVYDRQGRSQQALAEAERAVRDLDPDAAPAEAARIRAVRARLSGDLAAAEQAYRALAGDAPSDPEPLLELAAVLEEAGRLDDARAAFERAVALDARNAAALLAMGRVEFRLGRTAEALQRFNAALALHTETGNEAGRAAVLNALGYAYDALGRGEEALRQFRDSLAIAESIGDRRAAGAALNNIALALRDQGRVDEAVEAARRALLAAEEIGDRARLADRHATLGDILSGAGRNEEALAAYQRSLEIVRDLGDEESLARTLANIGYMHAVLGRYTEAFFAQKDALEKRRKTGDKEEILASLADLGALEQIQGRYDEALKYGLEGLALARDTGNAAAQIVLSANLAHVHEEQGAYAAALSLLGPAEAEARRTRNTPLLATVLTYGGSVRARLGDHDGAAAILDEATVLARGADNTALLAEILAARGRLLADRGRAAEARAVFREAAAAARRSGDRRLVLAAGMELAGATGSVSGLEAALRQVESLRLLPLVGPGRLALARIHRAAGRRAAALQQAEQARVAAASRAQRDVLFQAGALLATLQREAGRPVEAAAAAAAALGPLAAMREGLPPEMVGPFLARPATRAFAGEAERLFRGPERAQEAERLRALLGP
jgi:tetratricopeptide (TPR) repeat protein